MLTSIRYILITALRDWLFIGLAVAILLASGVSALLGSTAFLESGAMTITFASGAARLILMIGIIVFVCFHIRQAFDTKEIDVILSRPISRSSLMVAYWLGFSLVSFLLVLPISGLLQILGMPSTEGFFGWTLSLFCEAVLVVAIALFSAFALRSAVTAVLACMGFYVLSRMMAFFVVTAESGLFNKEKFIALKYALVAISSLVPRLDFFAKSEWLIYGFNTDREWQLFLLQTAIFVPILLLAAIADFRRKQF